MKRPCCVSTPASCLVVSAGFSRFGGGRSGGNVLWCTRILLVVEGLKCADTVLAQPPPAIENEISVSGSVSGSRRTFAGPDASLSRPPSGAAVGSDLPGVGKSEGVASETRGEERCSEEPT